MGNYLLDLMLDNYRVQTLQRILRSYKPQVSVSFVLRTIGFDDIETGLLFLTKIGCVFVAPEVDTSDEPTVVSSGKVPPQYNMDISVKDSIIDPSAVIDKDKLLL